MHTRMSPSFNVILPEFNDVERNAAPRELFGRGDSGLLHSDQPRVSIIGSRDAKQHDLDLAYASAYELAQLGVVIVSGLARGIDTAAHQGAIDAGGQTIAVLGAGFSYPYPPENKELFHTIGQDHLLLTQFPPDKPPIARNFPMRNRLMALVSDSTTIITATEESGTRHQAWEAIRLNRSVLLNSMLLAQEIMWIKQLQTYGAEAVVLPHGIANNLAQHGLISLGTSDKR